MSGVLKGIGKVFKKVLKVAKVVLPIALAIGAVVFTGGAALGVLPTFAGAIGGVVTSLGIGGAVGGALTGAIVSAGFGSAIGGATAAATGKPILKGMQTGALTGAVTGGVMGALNPATFGIIKTAEGWTTANALRTGSTFGAAGSGNQIAKDATSGLWSRVGNDAVGTGFTPPGNLADAPGTVQTVDPNTGQPWAAAKGTGLNAGGAVPGSSNLPSMDSLSAASRAEMGLPAAPTASTPPAALSGNVVTPTAQAVVPGVQQVAGNVVQAAAAPASTGLFGGMDPLVQASLLRGVGGFLSGGGESEAVEAVRARAEEERASAEAAYGGVYAGRENPFGLVTYQPPPRRWYFDPNTSSIQERRV